MKKYFRLFSISFAMITSQASAQITDPDQRMRWFNLQRLAIETKEIDTCRLLVQAEPKQKFQSAYDSAASETANAIEAYIKQFPNIGRFKDESTDAYRYRVWNVTMGVGAEKARSFKQLNQSECDLLTLTR